MNTLYMRRTQAAQYLKERTGAYTAATLAKFASSGGGPKFQKLGPFPVYTVEALDEWLASRTGPVVSNTAEAR